MLRKKGKIITDESQINELLNRGVEEIFPNQSFLEKELKKGEKLTLYLGIDPTGPTLHVGHAIVLKKLKEFQDLGHQIILLIGDFTAMIGDPTDKSATRKQLTRKEVLNNAKLYKTQASKFLNFSGKNAAQLKYNSKWLSEMKFGDVLELASHMTVEQMSKRDMFVKRTEEGKPVYIHEFMYPLMQGYDSVAMNVDGEVGGNDQMFNMLTGRTLVKQIQNKEKFVITMKLLEDATGKKMGKSEGNMLTLQDSPEEMFGKVMSWTDGLIVPGFELCTDMPINEISEIESKIKKGENPRDFKVALAKSIISFYHSKESADKAEKGFVNTFKEGGVPDNIPSVDVKKGTQIIDIDFPKEIITTKNELRRLLEGGSITSVSTKEKISDQKYIFDQSDTLKIGKRRFIDIKID